MAEIFDSVRAASADDIAAVELILGRALPVCYRDFLLSRDGGRPEPNIIDVPELSASPTDVQVLFGVKRSAATSCIAWNLALVRQRCTALNLLPVACDSGGNLFCIQFDDEGKAPLVYCDLDSEHCKQYPVAADFESFLAVLRNF